MATRTETALCHEWLHGVLAAATAVTGNLADGTAGIYRTLAPQGADAPYLLHQYAGGGFSAKLGTLGAAELLFNVEAVGEMSTPYDTLQLIAAAAHPLVQGQRGSATGGTVLYCSATTTIDNVETDAVSGQQFQHVGYQYQLTCRLA